MSDLDFGAKPGIPPAATHADAARRDAHAGAPLRSPIADATARRGEDELDRSLRPKTLDEFVGQRRVREQLRRVHRRRQAARARRSTTRCSPARPGSASA